MTHEPWEERSVTYRFNLGLTIPSLCILCSASWSVVVDCDNLHLLQTESFLMLKKLFKIENRLSKHQCVCIVVHILSFGQILISVWNTCWAGVLLIQCEPPLIFTEFVLENYWLLNCEDHILSMEKS